MCRIYSIKKASTNNDIYLISFWYGVYRLSNLRIIRREMIDEQSFIQGGAREAKPPPPVSRT